MTLQSSGQIKISEINTELDRTSTSSNTSVKNLNTGVHATINTNSDSTPNSSAPHQMSEFYSYNHDAFGATLTSVSIKFNSDETDEACGAELTLTYYHDGSSEIPTEDDNLYSDSSGNNSATTGYYVFGSTNAGAFVDDGQVTSETFSCGRSERRLKYNIEYMGDSPMGIPMYHFNYKNEEYGKGRFVGTMVDDLERLGFEKALIRTKDGIFVNYDKIDVPFHNITN